MLDAQVNSKGNMLPLSYNVHVAVNCQRIRTQIIAIFNKEFMFGGLNQHIPEVESGLNQGESDAPHK